MQRKISNSVKISENNIPGVSRMIGLDIIIEGLIISHFKHFQLSQSVKRHHHFTLVLAYDVLETVHNQTLEQTKDFLGKRVSVIFKYKDPETNTPERTFVGVITAVNFSQEKMSLGDIILSGYSPTILMDAAPHFQSFGGDQPVNTSFIADTVIKQSLDPGKFDISINSESKSNINYSAQYNETHYNYLARLSHAYGDQFYYDGEVIRFGKLPLHEPAIQLIYGSNINNVNIELNSVYLNTKYFGYNSSSHKKMTAGSNSSIRNMGEVSSHVYNCNKEIFKSESLTPAPINPNMFLDVDDSHQSHHASAGLEGFRVSGDTTVPFLYIGCVADIEMRKTYSNKTSYFTRVMITELTHEVDAKGYYKGSFQAISEGTGFMPKPDFESPRAEPQIATVVSNIDPLNQGRIKVRFDWQSNETTHFIRMMSPDAGGTEAVQHNRGFVTVPEIGDQVMVGFEYNHPDFPFAMGSMFHGGTGLGGGVNNSLKSLQTRSGIKILMNDDSKSITIEDPSGNKYVMDGQGNINVTAPGTFTINAGKDIILNAGNDMDVKAGNSMELMSADLASFHAVSGALFSAPLMEFTAPVHLNIQSGKTSILSEEETAIQGKTMHVAGMEKLIMHSDEETVVNSKGKTKIHGKDGNNLSNIPKDYNPLEKKMDGRCLAHFRPQPDWNGEGYGFDWVRAGDTDFPGDTDYSQIVGRIENKIFIKDEAEYRKLISSFVYYTFNYADDHGGISKKSYALPYISLYPITYFKKIKGKTVKRTSKYTNTKAELTILLDIKEAPQNLTFKYDTQKFQVRHDPLPLSEGNHKIHFTLICLEEISEDKRIEIFAMYTTPKGRRKRVLAGGIVVKANHIRYEVPVVFIEVKTNIGNNKKFPVVWAREHETQKFLNQALINPVFKESISLDCSIDIHPVSKIQHNRQSRFRECITVENGMIINEIHRDSALLNFLVQEVDSLYPGKYSNTVKVFFINEMADRATGYAVKAYSSAMLFSRGYDSDNRSVTTHEIMHVMGLEHTFETKSKFIFEKYTTDNLMDYSDAAGDERKKAVIQTYHWQWTILQQHAQRELSSSKYFKFPTPLFEIIL